MKQGFISKIQSYSTKDGPGIRTTVFFIGCNLSCVWCSNPELIAPNQKLMYYKKRCVRCGNCTNIAPIRIDEEGCHFKQNEIKDAQALVDICTQDAYEIIGTYYSSEELVDKLLRDRVFYETSNGGVTFSGGEAALQADFIKECAKRLHQEHIHIALDTTGNISWKIMQPLLEDIDLVLYDIKAVDTNLHKKCTGVDNALILENAKRIAQMHKEIWIRLVIVPNLNDDLEDIRKRFQFIHTLGDCVKRVDVLKYHHLGANKYEQLGMPYHISSESCDATLMDAIKEIAKQEQITIHIEN